MTVKNIIKREDILKMLHSQMEDLCDMLQQDWQNTRGMTPWEKSWQKERSDFYRQEYLKFQEIFETSSIV